MKVAEHILQIVLDLSVALSLAGKPQYFHTVDLKDAGGFTIASFAAIFENVTMSMLDMVCLIWKFSRGGRRVTFLPSNTKWRTNDCTICKRLRVLDSDFTI